MCLKKSRDRVCEGKFIMSPIKPYQIPLPPSLTQVLLQNPGLIPGYPNKALISGNSGYARPIADLAQILMNKNRPQIKLEPMKTPTAKLTEKTPFNDSFDPAENLANALWSSNRLNRGQKIANYLQSNALRNERIIHPIEGVAKLAEAILASRMNKKIDREKTQIGEFTKN